MKCYINLLINCYYVFGKVCIFVWLFCLKYSFMVNFFYLGSLWFLIVIYRNFNMKSGGIDSSEYDI